MVKEKAMRNILAIEVRPNHFRMAKHKYISLTLLYLNWRGEKLLNNEDEDKKNHKIK